jgi:hypothetical protein
MAMRSEAPRGCAAFTPRQPQLPNGAAVLEPLHSVNAQSTLIIGATAVPLTSNEHELGKGTAQVGN